MHTGTHPHGKGTLCTYPSLRVPTNKSTQWSIGCKIPQWCYNTLVHHSLQDSPYHLTFGQHPCVGISNLPISSEILQNLVAEAKLNDVYSNMTCGMITELLTQPLDPAIQEVITTVAEAIDDGITDIVTKPGTQNVATMESTSCTRRAENYNSTQDSCNAKRLKTLALGNAVIGNRIEKSGALDDITPSKKGPTGKSCDIDLSSVCWMQLILECDPQKPDDLTELKKAQIGLVFPIVCCINNKDIISTENWESCILKKVQKETCDVLNVHQNDIVEDDLDLEGDDDLKNTWRESTTRMLAMVISTLLHLLQIPKGDYSMLNIMTCLQSADLFAQRLLQTFRKRLRPSQRKHSRNCLPLA